MTDRPRKNAFTDLPPELRPRERMLHAACAEEMSDRDLLMVMLKTGTAGCDVEETAKRLLCAFGSTREFVRCPWQELEACVTDWNKRHPDRRVLGVGRAKLLEMAAAFELAKRGFRRSGADVQSRVVKDSVAAASIFRQTLAVDEERECFRVLLLDARRHPLCDPLPVSSGSIEGTFVHPREVFKDAIRRGAQSVVVAHNHPGGNPSPSDEDLSLTHRLVASGKMLGIPLLDHIVLGDGNPEADIPFVSIRALRLDIFL